MYVISGVTGHTGSAAAEALLSQGKKVRVLVRDEAKGAPWRARGAEPFVANYEDSAALSAAFRDAEGVYVLVPPGGWSNPDEADVRARVRTAILTAVGAARPKHVVALSSIGAQHAEGTGPIKALHTLEQGLRALSVPSSFVRAGFFMENWAPMVRGALAAGQLYYPLAADWKFPQVATKDIGATVASLLLDPPSSGARVIELSGPEDYSVGDVAAAISRAGNKPVAAVEVPVAALVEGFVKMGASHNLASLYGEMVEGMRSGLVTYEGGSARHARGTTPLDAVIGPVAKG